MAYSIDNLLIAILITFAKYIKKQVYMKSSPKDAFAYRSIQYIVLLITILIMLSKS